MPFQRSIFETQGGRLVYGHTRIDHAKPAILFLHGLGDRGCVFEAAFDNAGLDRFNLVAPDLLGYGESLCETAEARSYRFENQMAILFGLMDHIGIAEFGIVGHSMGGDIGSLMCSQDEGRRIRAFVNIEGDLTQADRFITDAAIVAHELGQQGFEHWLRHELIELLFDAERAVLYPDSRAHYAAAVQHCSADAFWTNVGEIRDLNRNLPWLTFAPAALLFERIRVPKDFYWSAESLSAGSQAYLRSAPFDTHPPFRHSCHWIMLDQPVEFYRELASFLQRAL